MKNLFFGLVIFAIYSFSFIGVDGGELVGVSGKKLKNEQVKLPDEISKFSGEFMYIPSGTYRSMTKTNIDGSARQTKTISVQAFTFGKGEITNLQYRTFYRDMVTRVGKDSARKLLPDTNLFVTNKKQFIEVYKDYYFSHPAYNNYPVTSITWLQAKAYCDWLNIKIAEILKEHPDWKKKYKIGWFRLPHESEWEYAAIGNFDNSGDVIWSWGKDLYRIEKSKLIWNGKFGEMSDKDGFIFKSVDDSNFDFIDASISNHPNIYGLYNLSGNVNEWTFSTYDYSQYDFSHDLNPSYTRNLKDSIPNAMKKYQDNFFDIKYGEKIFRGGSFLDGPMHADINLVSKMKPDSTRCDIGFRIVMTY
jgi:sulfatase modifying factor 1